MGLYINPMSETKEAFLQREGTLVQNDLRWEDVPEGMLPVVLYDNYGTFTGAAVCYDKKEFDGWLDPNDKRTRMIYLVQIKRIAEITGYGALLERADQST